MSGGRNSTRLLGPIADRLAVALVLPVQSAFEYGGGNPAREIVRQFRHFLSENALWVAASIVGLILLWSYLRR